VQQYRRDCHDDDIDDDSEGFDDDDEEIQYDEDGNPICLELTNADWPRSTVEGPYRHYAPCGERQRLSEVKRSEMEAAATRIQVSWAELSRTI